MINAQTHVLLVEDDALIGLDLAETLNAVGWSVDGPHRSVADALAAIARRAPDVALLDIDLGRTTTSEAVARRLRERAIPFAILTGIARDEREFPDAMLGVPCLTKPAMPDDVTDCVRALL